MKDGEVRYSRETPYRRRISVGWTSNVERGGFLASEQVPLRLFKDGLLFEDCGDSDARLAIAGIEEQVTYSRGVYSRL